MESRAKIATLLTISFLTFSIHSPAASAAAIDDVLATMSPGEWYEVPNTKMEAVKPVPEPPGIETVAAVMDSWSGGAFDTKRNRLIVWGGGHGAYSGNEIYTFDIDTLDWDRLIEPSYNVDGGSSPTYPDGTPRSRHTYNYLEYLPNVDRFISFGAAVTYPQGNDGFSDLVSFDFTSLQWDHSRTSIPSTGNLISSFAVYDPATGTVWQHGTAWSHLAKYNPINDSWTKYPSSEYLEYYCTPAIDPERRLLVCVGGKSDIRYWDLDNPSAGAIKPSTSGDKAMESVAAPGFQYDPKLKKFVAWHGGEDVYVLDPDTWEWTRISPAPSNNVTPTAGESRGTYGRFRYVPDYNIYVAVNRTNENVYLLKLTAGDGTTQFPTINMWADPSSVAAGGSTDIHWQTTDATSCNASGDWSGSKAATTGGSSTFQTVGPLNTDSTFGLSCSGGGGSTSTSISVAVTQSSQDTDTDSSDPVSGSSETETTSDNTSSANSSTSGEGGSGSTTPLILTLLLGTVVFGRLRNFLGMSNHRTVHGATK